MHRAFVALLLAFFVAGMFIQAQTGEALAQTRSDVTVQVRGGVDVPRLTPQFRDFYSVGRGVGGGVGYAVTSSVDLFVRGHYRAFVLDEVEVDGIIPEVKSRVDGSNGTIVSGTVGVRFRARLYDRMDFRLIGGIGAYRQSIYGAQLTNEADESDTFTFGAQKQTSPGLNFGIEIGVPLTERVQVAVIPTFVLVFGEPIDEDLPREQTGRVGFFSVDLGVSWTL
jgi:hypothetical protein